MVRSSGIEGDQPVADRSAWLDPSSRGISTGLILSRSGRISISRSVPWASRSSSDPIASASPEQTFSGPGSAFCS